MKLRPFGTTGEVVSALGFGCMRLPEVERDGTHFIDMEKAAPMLMRGYELGINYFDTAPYYCHGNSEKAVGEALEKVRDKVLLSTKCQVNDCKSPDDYERSIENSLKNLRTDHIDFLHFWGTNERLFLDKTIDEGFLDRAAKLKEQGLIRHISFSFHDRPEAIKIIVDAAEAHGVKLESMLCQYNILDRANEEMIAYVHEKGLGTVAMGPVGGGRLAAPAELYKKLTGKESTATYELAFKFCLGNPNLSCALSGMQTVEMVEQNAKIASDDTAFSPAEWEQLKAAMEQLKKFNELYCTGCAYCQPCPAGIDIPRIFKAYTYHNVYGLTQAGKKDLDEYFFFGGKGVTECIDCGDCEGKCPQHLSVRDELKRVTSFFDTVKRI